MGCTSILEQFTIFFTVWKVPFFQESIAWQDKL